MRATLCLIAATLPLAFAAPAYAGPAADKLAEHLYAGSLASGESEIAALAATGDAEAKAALGTIRFVRAIERFAQAMYRHGLEADEASFGPLLRMPVPKNPSPEPLTYDALRGYFSTLSADLDAAERTLAEVGGQTVKLPLATGRIRIDINGDGVAAENEQLIALAFGDAAPAEFRAQNEAFVVAFDTADVYWLRGYSNLLAGVADFWLAFDFRTAFDQTFHVIFPRAGLPNGEALATGSMVMGMEGDGLADLIALIHLMDWPVADRDRLQAIPRRFSAVVQLNGETWRSVRAETDDDREWLPAPAQKNGVMTGFQVTEERLAAWMRALAEIDDVLQGRKLMPHWRFQKGVNLKRAFDTADRFDLVLWVTGQGVLPFLEDGPIADGEALAAADRIFEGDLLTYALWFN